jgi:hypothetical protein
MKERFISYECMEEIAQWVRTHCCLSLVERDGREFLRGLYFIVEEELRTARATLEAEQLERLRKPSSN